MKSYRAVLICALVPLVVGTAVFLGWVLFAAPWLVVVGVSVVLIGLLFFAMGVARLADFIRDSKASGAPHQLKAAFGALALLINFPVAFLYSLVGYAMMTAILVTIENETALPVENIVFYDPRGTGYPVSDLAPHSSYSTCFNFRGEGGVTYAFDVGETHQTGVLEPYVTPGLNTNTTIEIEVGATNVSNSFESLIPIGSLRLTCLRALH